MSASPTRPEVVLWDVDNTLADSTSLAFGATNKVLEGAGFEPISMEGYLEGTRHTTPNRMAWHAVQDAEHKIGRSLAEEFDDLYISLVSVETVGFYQGLAEVVRELDREGVRHGSLSNACGRYVRAVLEANGVADLFLLQLGADEVPAAKPQPDGLLMCCEQLGVEPERCVYVGDAPSDGVAAAAAGMPSVGVCWGAHSETQLEGMFDQLVFRPAQLRKVLLAGVPAAARQ